MSTIMSASDPAQAAFESSKQAFKDSLQDPNLFDEILRTQNIGQVYDATEKLQREMGNQGRLRHLGKIGPCLERLSGYAAVIDTFVQAKPDVLALIWGPIRILLLWSSRSLQLFDAITSAVERIGEALPEFCDIVRTFSPKETLKDALCPQYFFEAVWPKQKAKIDVVINNIGRHTLLMRNKVTFEHIKEEHEARVRSLAHYEQANEFHEDQIFDALRTRFCPSTYDKRLDWLRNRACEGAAKWLLNDRAFTEWLDTSNQSTRLLWLQGIPGAGKTFLSAAAVDAAKAQHSTLFVFASHLYRDNECNDLKVLISSRAEDDIAKILEKKARIIRAHTRNSDSIQAYVDYRSRDWMEKCDLDRMFLYARILMDNLELLSGIEEIREELRAYPKDLEAA
ncbi:hypothetical protein DL768_002614 [Monosporascus sp. mg162]|nr:hypothetical protein DL768_002614 [Monosporascus sp. mg162]